MGYILNCMLTNSYCIDCFAAASSTFCLCFSLVSLLLNLVSGKVPGIHGRDYITAQEAHILGLYRPDLRSFTSVDHRPLVMYISLMLTSKTSKRDMANLEKVLSQTQWVQVKIKGLTLLGLSSKVLSNFPVNVVSSATVCHMYLSELCCDQLSEMWDLTTMPLLHSLWVSNEQSHIHHHPMISILAKLPKLGSLSLLMATSQRANELGSKLSKLAGQMLSIKAFCLLRQDVAHTSDLCQALDAFLWSTSEKLEYLQLWRWSLSAINLDSILHCCNLRVLCVTEESTDCGSRHVYHSISDILAAITQLTYLEFFQWSENINMTTAGLLTLHGFLSTSAGCLKHFHVHLPYLLLSTVDLASEKFSVLSGILLPLLDGKVGNEVCSTYLFNFDNEVFQNWLQILRPDVCFRLNRDIGSVKELHQAATFGNHVY